MGVDKVKTTCQKNVRTQLPSGPTEHVLRADGQDLASSSSYPSP